MTLHPVTDLAGCQAVVALQIEVWGVDAETVPASLLSVSIKRGGILIGAYDAHRLVGFVWSMAAVREGRLTQWSHMLAVHPDARGLGLGVALKRAQRDRALDGGVDLIEWTFDPLQAANAHLNLARLGAVSSHYVIDAYGAMIGPLHRGTPTDRLVAEWWLRDGARDRTTDRADREAAAIATRPAGTWVGCHRVDTALDAPRVLVPVPPRFTEMQRQAVETAHVWRLATREVFTAYFARGYRAVEFRIDRTAGGGCYVLDAPAAP